MKLKKFLKKYNNYITYKKEYPDHTMIYMNIPNKKDKTTIIDLIKKAEERGLTTYEKDRKYCYITGHYGKRIVIVRITKNFYRYTIYQWGDNLIEMGELGISTELEDEIKKVFEEI